MSRLFRFLLVLGVLCTGMLSVPTDTGSLWAKCNCRKCRTACKSCNHGCKQCGKCQRIPSHADAVQMSGAYCQNQGYGRPDLFYNYYADPNCGAVSAQMYMAPRPVPPLVGHTYYTYQPLMPHEMLYPHYRTYHKYYNCGRGLTRTKVVWKVAPLQAFCENLYTTVKLAR